MDFRALPRRDLQALCKRNGVRANMTNAAMAEALAALPTVDGIEEYVKEPVTVPTPEVKSAAVADEHNREKQGSPPQRGGRVTVKAVETDGAKGDEKRESAKEDAPALGVGRRGPIRRARPAPVVATSMVVPVGKEEEAEDKQDGSKEEDQRRDAKKEDPPAPVVGRRAASRRARPELAAESAAAGAVEGQRKKDGSPAPRGRRGAVKSSEPIRTGDCEEEAQELQHQAGTDGAPALGVGRRGACRRARPSPALAEPAGKVIEEEKAPPIPRGRHVKAKSTEPIKPNDDEEDKKTATKPEEEGDVPALDVGRRGAARRVRRAPAVAGKVAAEDELPAPIPHGHCVKVKSPEVIRLDDTEDEEKEDTKLDEKDDEAPAIGVGRRSASRRAPAPVEAPATRRRAATSKDEAVGVTEEAVPTRATRQRKPTMKAAAAAEEKALPKATGRKAVMKTVSQQEEQEKPQEEVPAPISSVGRDNPEDPEEASGPQNREQKQKHEVVVIIEDEIPMEETPAEELLVTDQESMDHSTLRGQEVCVEKCPFPLASQDDSPIMGLVSMATEQAADKDEGAIFQDGEGSSGSLDKGVFEEILDAGEEIEMVSIIQGLHASLTEEHTEEVVTGDANHKSEIGSVNEVPHGTEETSETNTEDDLVSQNKEDINIDELQADLADGSVLLDCSGNIKLFVEEETNEVNTEDGVSFQEKGDVPVDMPLPDTVAETSEANAEDDLHELQADLADGSVLVDCSGNVECSGNIKLFIEEETNEVNTEDGVPFDMALLAETILSGCSSDFSCVQVEKSGDVTSKSSESPAALDEDGEETNSYADICHADKPSGDSLSHVTVTDSEVVQEEKVVVITEEVSWSTAAMHGDIKLDQCQTRFIHGDQVVAADTLTEVKLIDCEVEEEETTMIIDEQQQSTVTMDEYVIDNHIETDVVHADEQKEVVTIDEVPEFTGTGGVLEEDKAAVITEEMPQSTGKMDEGEAVVIAEMVPQSTDCEEKTTLIIDDKQQSTVTMDEAVVGDHSETDELKEVATDDKVPHVTGTEARVIEKDKAAVITEEVPHGTGTMDDCVQQNYFQIGFIQDYELNDAVTFDNVPEITEIDGAAKNTFVCDLPRELNVAKESNGHITQALVDNVAESLCKSIITVEPTMSVSDGITVCNNSSEKNTTELEGIQEDEVVKVAKNSMDLTKLSLGQLRTKLKEKLNAKKNKEAKRVALARVDENVCRSHSKGQQQNLNLQQH